MQNEQHVEGVLINLHVTFVIFLYQYLEVFITAVSAACDGSFYLGES